MRGKPLSPLLAGGSALAQIFYAFSNSSRILRGINVVFDSVDSATVRILQLLFMILSKAFEIRKPKGVEWQVSHKPVFELANFVCMGIFPPYQRRR